MIEKVLSAVPTLLTVMPVNVMGPVPAEVLETVTVRLAGAVVTVVGTVKAITPWVTVNPTGLLVVSPLLTVRLCVPTPAVIPPPGLRSLNSPP